MARTLIQSALSDNWERVKIIHAVAHELFKQTRGSDFRRRIIGHLNVLPFDVSSYDLMAQESKIVGLVMAWSVVTLESLANHVLAETINNKACAIMAIEYPGQVIEKLGIYKSAKSELAKKTIILNFDFKVDSKTLDLCDDLANIRNKILHDKPFDYILNGEEIEVKHFSTRGNKNEDVFKYDDLVHFFRKCDQVIEALTRNAFFSEDCFSFGSLLKDKLS